MPSQAETADSDGEARPLGRLACPKNDDRATRARDILAVGKDSETYKAFQWVEGVGSTILPVFNGALYSDANGVSGDGRIAVGCVGTMAVRWVDMGDPESLGFTGVARATNEDGTVIVGAAAEAPFVWTEAGGLEFLVAEFENRGVDLSGWTLSSATDISADGSVIVGEGTYEGMTRAWIAYLSDTGIAGQ